MSEKSEKFVFFRKERKLSQVFSEVCRYSCSHAGEQRNFVLIRQFYLLKIFKLTFKFFESVTVACDNCGWKKTIPASFAKKIFKNGVKSSLIMKYSKNKVVTSRILNFWGSLWRLWLLAFAALIVVTIFRFFSQPVLVNDPKNIAFADVYNKDNLGRIVQISGKVDYTLAFTRNIYVSGDKTTVLETEVYLPLFNTNGLEYIVIKGGDLDLSNVEKRLNVTNSDLLKNQDYTVVGKLETVDNLTNADLNSFFLSELPKSREIQAPKILINSAEVVSLPNFANEFVPYYSVSVAFLVSSIAVQIYIDKKLFNKIMLFDEIHI